MVCLFFNIILNFDYFIKALIKQLIIITGIAQDINHCTEQFHRFLNSPWWWCLVRPKHVADYVCVKIFYKNCIPWFFIYSLLCLQHSNIGVHPQPHKCTLHLTILLCGRFYSCFHLFILSLPFRLFIYLIDILYTLLSC